MPNTFIDHHDSNRMLKSVNGSRVFEEEIKSNHQVRIGEKKKTFLMIVCRMKRSNSVRFTVQKSTR